MLKQRFLSRLLASMTLLLAVSSGAVAQMADCSSEAARIKRADEELPKLDVAPPGDRTIVCITLETNLLFATPRSGDPESILRSGGYGFRVRELRSRPGMTEEPLARLRLSLAAQLGALRAAHGRLRAAIRCELREAPRDAGIADPDRGLPVLARCLDQQRSAARVGETLEQIDRHAAPRDRVRTPASALRAATTPP